MADEDRGNSIRQDVQRNDIVSTIMAQLDTTLGSKMGELIRIMGEINDRDKRDRSKTDSTSSFRRGSLDDLLGEFKSAGKTLKDFEKSIGSASEAVSSQRDKWNRQVTHSGETGAKKVYSAKMAKLTSDIENELADLAEKTREDIKAVEDEYNKAKKQKLLYIESLQSEIEQLDEGIKNASSNRKKRELADAKLQKEKEIEYTQSEIEKIEKPKKDNITAIINASSKSTEALMRKLRENKDEVEQEYSVLMDAIDNAFSASGSLKGSSQYFSQFAKTPEDEETELDKLSREIEKQKDLWLSALQAIDKRLKEDETLTEIERDNLLKQREYINKQIDISNKWTPAREQFSKSVKTLGDAAKNIISSIGKTVLKRFEDYYLTSYKESFQKVYDSVENTRNTVSARLKLDQGGFSDLQSEIQNEIEELGIESSVTQADVNDALVSLQAAGVTDKDMLKTLAIEQAKLIASGSSLNLGNEETIQNLRQIYQQQLQATGDQQEALNNLSSLIQTAGTAQSAIGASGWDSSLVNGGADRLFNQVANIGITAGKSIEQMSNDLTAAFATSEHMYGIGQDPDAIYSLVNDIINKSVGDYSTLEKILLTSNEISRDALLDSNASLEQNYQDIYSAMKDILQSGTEGDKKYLAEVLSAYGFDMSPEQAVKFMEAADAIRVPTEAEMKQAEAIDKQAREQGTFLSATEKHLNEAQNSMTEIAISAEKLYKGNDYVLEGFNAVETGLGAIEDVAKNILASIWTNSSTGRAVSSFNLTPEMAKDFAFGTKGTTAGAIGKGASIAVGAGMMGVSGYNIISSGIESGQAGLDTAYDLLTDTTFQAGLGTTIGGAMGGPVGAAVGGAIFGTFSKLGNWLGSTEKGTEIFAKVMGLPSLEDASQTLAKEMTEDANENILAAQKQIEASDEMLAKFEKMTNDQKKLELLQKDKITAQEAATITQEDLNKLFEENIVADAKRVKEEAELLRAEQEMKLKNAIQIASVNETFGESGLGGNAIDAMKKFAGMVGGKEAAADVFTSIESEIGGMDDASLKAYLQGYNGLTADDLGNKSTDELRSLASKKKASNLGFTDGALEVVDFAYSEWGKRKQRYDEANTKFISRWGKIDTGGNIWSSIAAYEDAYLKDASPDELRAFGEGIASGFASTGKVQLPTYKGNYYLDDYVEGHQFRTGLTEVPSDNYPALLHRGERVLTKEEAKVYNEMSSFAVSNLINTFNGRNSSSNVFSTTSYGVDFDKSIGTQTDVISKKLDQVISAIEKLNISLGNASRSSSAAYQNVVRGNSNITQLNTL
jgi:hypothetical protein